MNRPTLERAVETFSLDDSRALTFVDAAELMERHYPPFPPDATVIITDIQSREQLNAVHDLLLAVYPAQHLLKLPAGESVELKGLAHMDATIDAILVPPREERTSFEALAEIVAHLRAPNGCPWDREQTHLSLRAHLLEEAYETLAAIDAGDTRAMREEFGDLLLQIMLNSQIASEAGEFNVADVIKSIADKLIRRHPHVFGDTKVRGVDEVLENWEKLKAKERSEQKSDQGILQGVPLAMPALSVAQEYQDRSARVGFDWPQIDGVLDKAREEIEELKQSTNTDQFIEEFGDLLFVLVNLARWKGVDAESALRAANMKFSKRFGYVEATARSRGKQLTEMTLEDMDALWDQAKAER